MHTWFCASRCMHETPKSLKNEMQSIIFPHGLSWVIACTRMTIVRRKNCMCNRASSPGWSYPYFDDNRQLHLYFILMVTVILTSTLQVFINSWTAHLTEMMMMIKLRLVLGLGLGLPFLNPNPNLIPNRKLNWEITKPEKFLGCLVESNWTILFSYVTKVKLTL